MTADLILKSDFIFSSDGGGMRPGIVAVRGNTICYAGPERECSRWQGGQTRVVDTGGGMVLPGFHDAHMHVFFAALLDSPLVANLNGLPSEAACVEALREFAAARSGGRWLVGIGWYHLLWDTPALPTCRSLDRTFPDTPVCLIGAELHTIWLNSEAMRRLDCDALARNDPNFIRDPSGRLTGVVLDVSATALLSRALDFTPGEEEEFYRTYLQKLSRMGITSVCDLSLTVTRDMGFVRGDIYQRLEQRGQLPLRVSLYPALTEQPDSVLTARNRYHSPLLRFGGGKQFYDGVSSSHTAWLKEPYTSAPEVCGAPVMPEERMAALLKQADGLAVPLRVHTIGDQAVHSMIDDYISLGCSSPLILEHLEDIQAEDPGRMAKAGIIASVQPLHLLLDPASIERDLGPERIRRMWAFRTFLDAGCTVAFGTDCPVVPPDPLRNMYAAVTRTDPDTGLPGGGWIPEQRITIPEAIVAYTAGSAKAAGVDGQTGTLAPGMAADLVVLDRPLLQPEDLLRARVKLTMVNGQITWEESVNSARQADVLRS